MNAPARSAPPSAAGLVLLAVVSLQVGAAFSVQLFDDLGAAGAAFGRLALAAVVLLALWRPRVRGHGAADLRVAVAFGLVLGGMNLCIYEAMDRIPLGIAVTFEFVGPLGVAFALAAGALWAGYILLGARTGRAFPGGTGLAIAMAVGALAIAPFGIASAGNALLRPEPLGAILAVALASSVLPYSLELEALRRVPAAVFGVLMSLEPAVAALAGFVVLGQDLAARDWLAIVLVVVASAGATAGAAASAPRG